MARFGAVFSHTGQIGLLGLLAAGLALGFFLGLKRVRGGFGSARMDARRQWARCLADAAFDGLLVHRNGTILQMNRALVRMLGYREMELLGTHFANLGIAGEMAALRTELEAPQPQIAGFTLLHADKSERKVEMASHTLEVDGLPATVTAIRDVTAQRELEVKLAYLTHNDALTGLANAAMFAEKLQDSVSRNDAAGGTTAVLTLELATVKAVTALLGRKGGDILLRQAANRLCAMVHENDIVARLSGNHLAIVQPHEGAPNRTAILTSQIEAAMEEPFIVEGLAVRASMAIGVAIYPEHATGAEGLIDASGFALSKAIEKGGVHVFSHAEATAAGFNGAGGIATAKSALGGLMLSLEEQRLAHDLRLAASRGEIGLEYQPVFGGRFLNLAGYEALARWRHPKDGAIPPATFLKLAEAAGLGSELGNFILEAACAEAMRCKAPMMAVNLSAAQFRNPLLPSHIGEILRKTGLNANRLELQVTEAMVLEDADGSARRLTAIQKLGVVLTLDDFGTGFASLSNLAAFPFNRIRIDEKYIRLLGEDKNAQAIVATILALARSLHMEVTAEGVESEAQLSFLQEKDCPFVQGFYLGRPGPQASPQVPSPQAANLPVGGKPSLVVTQR